MDILDRVNLGLALSGACDKEIDSPVKAVESAHRYLDKKLINSVEVFMAGHPPHKAQNIGPWDYDDQLINNMKEALKPFPFKGAHIPFAFINLASLNPGIREESYRQIMLSLEIASKMSLNYVTTHPRFGTLDILSKEEEWDIWLDSYSRLTQRAKELGVVLTIENGDRLSFEECAEMAREINSPFFAMTFDTGHANLEGNKDGKYKKYKSLSEFTRAEADCFKNVHIHDNHLSKGDEHLPPGQGDIDFKGLFDALLENDPKRFIITMEFKWTGVDYFLNYFKEYLEMQEKEAAK
jgi:sugar phosphate isomerase/epimerase